MKAYEEEVDIRRPAAVAVAAEAVAVAKAALAVAAAAAATVAVAANTASRHHQCQLTNLGGVMIWMCYHPQTGRPSIYQRTGTTTRVFGIEYLLMVVRSCGVAARVPTLIYYITINSDDDVVVHNNQL